jgi:hypothetical protein
MTNNYIASARDALATPLKAWNTASNAVEKKASGLGAIAIAHEIKSTDTFAPILGKDKVNPKSTASVELFAMLKEVLVETCLPKPEQALYHFDLDAYRKDLGITLKEKRYNVDYQKKAEDKSKVIQRVGSKMRDFRDVLKTAENVDEDGNKKKTVAKTPIVSVRDNIKRVYNILNNETKLSDGFISHELKLGDDGSMERTKLLTTIQILYNKLGGQDLLGGKD